MKEGETMIRNQKIAIMLVILLGLSALLAVIISSYQTSQPMGFPFAPREFRINPGDIELYYMVQTVLSTVNIVLTAVLIFNYAGIYAKTKSEFTLGLLLFAKDLQSGAIGKNRGPAGPDCPDHPYGGYFGKCGRVHLCPRQTF